MHSRLLTALRQAVSSQDDKTAAVDTAISSKQNHVVYCDLENPQNVSRLQEHMRDCETRRKKVTRLLDEGRHFEALFIANLSNWIEPGPLDKANFDENQPRDHRGWWARTGQRDTGDTLIQDVQYRGFFHDVVVDDLLRGLAKSGGTALKNIKVLGLNGILAIPDGMSRPTGWTKPYFIEVKTGEDPPFTPNQQQVYPLICIGGHAVSTASRISQLGLTPGVPLPPLDILLVHTHGPGMPLTFIDYCAAIGLRGPRNDP